MELSGCAAPWKQQHWKAQQAGNASGFIHSSLSKEINASNNQTGFWYVKNEYKAKNWRRPDIGNNKLHVRFNERKMQHNLQNLEILEVDPATFSSKSSLLSYNMSDSSFSS